MESVKYSRLEEFYNAANAYITENSKERSSLTYALNKLILFYREKIKNIKTKWQDEINEAVEDIRAKHCEKDEKTGTFKERVYGEGQNLVIKKLFTAENEKIADREIRSKARELESTYMDYVVKDCKTHFVDVPQSIDIIWIEAFKDFVFKPMSEEELEAHYIAQGKKDTEQKL